MLKWLIGLISCLVLLQGCDSNDREKPINRETETEKEKVNMTKEINEQLLHATENGEINIIRELIQKGADLDVQDAEGRTPVMIATYNHDIKASEILIKAGANVDIQDKMRNNPFLYAGAEGYTDILRLTIEAHADPTITNRYGGTALIPASEHGHLEVIKELLTKTDINVNHINDLGWTALLEAIILSDGNERQQQTIQLLIQHGADVNLPDKDNVTPLQHAHIRGFKEIEEILLTAGAK